MGGKKLEPKVGPKREHTVTWKDFEQVVERIQRALAPDATVTTERLKDRSMKRRRQVDVVVRTIVGGQNVVLIFECRDHDRAVGAPYVESIAKKRERVRANKAVIVSATGFTQGARDIAADEAIDLMTLKEASEAEWSDWLVPRELTVLEPRSTTVAIQLFFTADDVEERDLDLDAHRRETDGMIHLDGKFLIDADGEGWSPRDLIAHLSATAPDSLFGDVPKTQGPVVRKLVRFLTDGIGISVPRRGGGRVSIPEIYVTVDLSFTRGRSVPFRLARYQADDGRNVAEYADASFETAGLDGQSNVATRAVFVRDDKGRLSFGIEGGTVVARLVMTPVIDASGRPAARVEKAK